MNKETINPRRLWYAATIYSIGCTHIHIQNRRASYCLYPSTKIWRFLFQDKAKNAFLCRHRPFLRSVYCKDTFFVQYDALLGDYYSLLLKERYTFQKRFFITFRFTSLHDCILYLCRQAPWIRHINKKGVRTFFPLIKKQASPNTNSETSENKNPTPYFGMQPDIAIVLYTRFA